MFDLKLKDLKRILNEYVQKNNAFPLSLDALFKLISEDFKTRNINVEVNFASYSQTREHCIYLLQYLLLNSVLLDNASFPPSTHQNFPAFKQMVRSTQNSYGSSSQTPPELSQHTSKCSIQGIYANLAVAETCYLSAQKNPTTSADNTTQYEKMFTAALKAFEYSKQYNSNINLIYIIDVIERIPQKSYQHFKLLAEIQSYRARNIRYQNQDNESYRDCVLGMIKYYGLALNACDSTDEKTKSALVGELTDIYRRLEHTLPMHIVRDITMFWDFISAYRQEMKKLQTILTVQMFKELTNAYGFYFKCFVYGLTNKDLFTQNKAFLRKQMIEMLPLLTIDILSADVLIAERYILQGIAQSLLSIATRFISSTDNTDLNIAQKGFLLARKFLGTPLELNNLASLYLEGQAPLIEGETREANAAECYARAMSMMHVTDPAQQVSAIKQYRVICNSLPIDKRIDLKAIGLQVVGDHFGFMQKHGSFSCARTDTWNHVFHNAILTDLEPSTIQDHLMGAIKPEFTLYEKINAKVLVSRTLRDVIDKLKKETNQPEQAIQLYSQFAASLEESFCEDLKGVTVAEFDAVIPIITAVVKVRDTFAIDITHQLIKLDRIFFIRMTREGVIQNNVELLKKIRYQISQLYGKDSIRSRDINAWLNRATAKSSKALIMDNCEHMSTAESDTIVSFTELENNFLKVEQQLLKMNDSNCEELLFYYLKIATQSCDQWGIYPLLALNSLKTLRDQCADSSTSFTDHQKLCIRFYYKATLFVVDKQQFTRDIGRLIIYGQEKIAEDLLNNSELTHNELILQLTHSLNMLKTPNSSLPIPSASVTNQERAATSATLVPPPSLAFFNGMQKNASEVSDVTAADKSGEKSANSDEKDQLILQLQADLAELRGKFAKLTEEKSQLQEKYDQQLTAVDSFYKHSMLLRSPARRSKESPTASESNITEAAIVEKPSYTP